MASTSCKPPAKLARTPSSPTATIACAVSHSPSNTNANPIPQPPPLLPLNMQTSGEPAVILKEMEEEEATAARRVSFYVQAADEMLEAVFKHELFLFSEVEQQALLRFQNLDYGGRYLFVRLYLRKQGWIRLDGLKYENDIEDLDSACEQLFKSVELAPARVSTPPVLKPQPRKVEDPYMIDLTGDDDDDEDGRMEEKEEELDLSVLAMGRDALAQENAEVVLGLLGIEELVALGKKMKVTPGKALRREWTQALLRTSSQSTLSFLPSSKGKEKENSDVKPLGAFGVSFDAKGNKLKASSVVSTHALKTIGPVIQLSPSYRTLFDRLSLVYHRTSYTASTSSSSSTTSFTASLLARFGRRHYPTYVVSRSFSIFPSRDVLKQYEEALAIERRIEEILGETGWTYSSSSVNGKKLGVQAAEEKKSEKEKMWREGVELFGKVEGKWKVLCREAEKEMKDEKDVEEKGLLYYRRRFHPGWPLTRVVYKAASIFAKLDDHDREVELLRALLAQTSFRRGKRGDWYDRLALVMMKYPLGEETSSSCGPKKKARLEKKRKEDVLEVCLKGLEDPYTHLIYKSSLQRRITRIESSLEVLKAERRVFDALVAKAETRIMEGERLDDPTIGKKSVWRASDGAEVSVEELALEQYVKEGWKGFHSENGILTTIFALIFWDIIFAPVDGVFETAFQSGPLDLSTDAFAIVRRPLINARLAAIEQGNAATFLAEADDRERPLETWAVGVNFEKFVKDDLLEVVECIGGPGLATILTVFVEEYGHRTGGIPDLCLWNLSTSTCLFSEVKGPGDKLSETQKVWIDVLLGAGVGVEMCRVMTSDEKEEMEEKDRGKKNGKGKKRARTEDSEED